MRRVLFAAILALWALPAWGVDCQYRATTPTLPDQGLIFLQCDTEGHLIVSSATNSTSATYAAGFDVNGYATPTDLWSIRGSATKTIKITRIELSGTATTSTSSDLLLVKRSTANTGGTPTTIAATPYDSAKSAATATLVSYAAAPTLGTLVGGALRDSQITMPPAASSTPALTYLVWDFSHSGATPIVLRGTDEGVALNFQGAALPAGFHLSVSIEWTEE